MTKEKVLKLSKQYSMHQVYKDEPFPVPKDLVPSIPIEPLQESLLSLPQTIPKQPSNSKSHEAHVTNSVAVNGTNKFQYKVNSPTAESLSNPVRVNNYYVSVPLVIKSTIKEVGGATLKGSDKKATKRKNRRRKEMGKSRTVLLQLKINT